MPIKIELWDYNSNGSHTYIGETTASVNEMRHQKIDKKIFYNKQKKKVGELLIKEVRLTMDILVYT